MSAPLAGSRLPPRLRPSRFPDSDADPDGGVSARDSGPGATAAAPITVPGPHSEASFNRHAGTPSA
jgi:hypothetical protein